MKKLGLILAVTLISGVSLAAPSFAKHRAQDSAVENSGPYHQDRLPDGTLTGPIALEANGD